MITEKQIKVPISSQGDVLLDGRALVNPESDIALVITHPYAKLGGEMNNNVVVAMFRHFAAKGFNVVRFNFRGVGASQGSPSWTASAETEDVRSVCRFLLGGELNTKITKIILVGYSFGSICSSAVADDFAEVLGYVTIAYPLTYLWALTLFQGSTFLAKAKTLKPKLFIIGTNDNFTSVSSFQEMVDSMPEPKSLEIIQRADHFFVNREKELCAVVERWLASTPLGSEGSQSSL